MKKEHKAFILQLLSAEEIQSMDRIQSLWSGYGGIFRCVLHGGMHQRVIVKLIQLPEKTNHPRGWNTTISHQRKVRSYEVECSFYESYSDNNHLSARIPKYLGSGKIGTDTILVLEDLDFAGYSSRKTNVSMLDMTNCIRWLARFHASYMGVLPNNLWPVGTYWHLETRPDELEVMEEDWLKEAAHWIDDQLSNSPYQTLVHGDAKLANFCFAESGDQVAAVDFQYVGGGCGMKDLAYFLGSCMYDDELADSTPEALDLYFQFLRNYLGQLKIQKHIIDNIERSWRSLYPLAVADFYRFLCGWSPGHWKMNSYSEQVARQVVQRLNEQ